MSSTNRALVPSYIASLKPYVAGKSMEEIARQHGLERVIKLASNENPLGPSPRAVERLSQSLAGLNIYPTGLDLRRALADVFGTRLENVITGSGSEGLMANIVRTFLGDDDEVLSSEGTFIGFKVLVEGRGVPYRTVPLGGNWHIDLAALARAITPKTKIIYLANPNNPTGTIFTKQEFDDFYKHVPPGVLIILDEAYFEYARYNARYPDSMFYRYDNVITLRTFSKIYGLAGVRIGYGFAHEELIHNLLKVKLPFEPSTLASVAGIGALEDREFLHRSLETNVRGQARLRAGLKALGLEPVPSETNFLMVPLANEATARTLTQELEARGMIIRHLASFGLPRCVRISIGTDEENELLLATLNAITLPLASSGVADPAA